jgi:hypothetical protein
MIEYDSRIGDLVERVDDLDTAVLECRGRISRLEEQERTRELFRSAVKHLGSMVDAYVESVDAFVEPDEKRDDAVEFWEVHRERR